MTTPTSSGHLRGMGTWSGPGSRKENRLRLYNGHDFNGINLSLSVVSGARKLLFCWAEICDDQPGLAQIASSHWKLTTNLAGRMLDRRHERCLRGWLLAAQDCALSRAMTEAIRQPRVDRAHGALRLSPTPWLFPPRLPCPLVASSSARPKHDSVLRVAGTHRPCA